MPTKFLKLKSHETFLVLARATCALSLSKAANSLKNNQEKQVEVLIKSIPILPSKPGIHLEVQDGNTIYRCCLDNGKEVTKWIDVLNIFYELNNK